MLHQMSLFNTVSEKTDEENSEIKILMWNIQNPSLERTRKQLDWIFEINPNVLILTEVKDSRGFDIIQGELEYRGYELVFERCNSYFTVIALKNIKYEKKEFNLKREY
jgi:hypothetical protein